MKKIETTSKYPNKCGGIDQNDLQEIFERLKAGALSYLFGKFHCVNQPPRKIKEQKPYAAILSCADSRVDPERLFDAGPGELFVTRVAGNVATDEIIASLEYAVDVLGTRVILVIGHEGCGAVDAARKQVVYPPKEGEVSSLGFNLDRLLALIRPAICSHDESKLPEMIKKNAEINAERLFERSKILNGKKNELLVLTAYYSFIDWGEDEEFAKIKEFEINPVHGLISDSVKLMYENGSYS